LGKILFDSHTHLNYETWSCDEREALIERTEKSDVDCVLDVAYDIESARLAVSHARRLPWCYAAVGIHPHDAEDVTDETLAEIEELAQNQGVKAIGEIGLDYFRDLSPRDVQQDVFRRQIRLALKLEMPMTIHDRESGGDTIRILSEEGAFGEERKRLFPANPVTGYGSAGVLLHCFSGSSEQAVEYIRMGATISIAGPVTYKNNKKTIRVATEVPLEHLLIETDAPFLTPEPHRGKPNEPAYVEYVARKIAELKGLSYEEVALATRANALRFFNIKEEG